MSSSTDQPARFSGKYWLRLMGFLMVVMSVAFLGLLVYFINRQVQVFVTPHRNANVGVPDGLGMYEDVSLTAADGLKISGWYIPGSRPEAIVLVHGINANRRTVLPEATVLADTGYHLLLIDLRAHGKSEGEIATYGYNEALDVQAAVDYLLALPEVEQVAVLGTSFGGAAVVRAAAHDPRIKAVVIESSYSNMENAVKDAFEDLSIFPQSFAPLLVKLAERKVGLEINQVDSARDLATLSPRSVLIIHGTDDRLFPLYHAYLMYEAAQEPKELWIIEGMGHQNPVLTDEAEYRRRVLPFFENAFASSAEK